MYDTIRYEVDDSIAVISLARAERRNAQNIHMTYELNAAFDEAAHDEGVKVIVLRGDGPHFSAGHDLKDLPWDERHQPIGTAGEVAGAGVPGWMSREDEIYLEMCRRWYSIPKPTIASVQGKALGGGLMLCWVCDLIVAAEDAAFGDPVITLGVGGVEWFVHAYELGHRKAKEHLFTGEPWSAPEAYRLGMVNHVVPADDLDRFTLDLAGRIAAMPPFALRLAKQAVIQSLEAQGQSQAIASAYGLHHLAHAHNMQQFGVCIDPRGVPQSMREGLNPSIHGIDADTAYKEG